MSESETKNTFRQEFEAHLNSPKPILMRLRNTVFGKIAPDTFTQIYFFVSLFIWIIFFVWSFLSLLAIWSRFWIEHNKNLPVSELIHNRGVQLGFEPNQFLERLESFHLISICIWTLIFIGLVLVWRKKSSFKWFIFVGASAYLVLMWTMLGFTYWFQDTTTFDKVSFIVFLLNTGIYSWYFHRKIQKTTDLIEFNNE